ncbi:MAG: hypothetical protein H5T68_12500 [Chloroflexi bacterium]|nr:hypothetical protein [Chloroflexota bacterium]
MSNTRMTKPMDVWITILALGSLWGFSEVVVNGLIQRAGLPFRAAILTGIGFCLMAIAVALFRKPWMLAGIAVVAILCKQLVVPILHVSVLCKANSCLAVLLEGLALAGAVSLAGRVLLQRGVARAGTGAAGALLAAGAFHYLGIRLAPCQYLLSFNRPGGLLAFLVAEGVPWAISSALLFPLGYRIGEWLEANVLSLRLRQPVAYYAANAGLIAACWAASAVAIAAGF